MKGDRAWEYRAVRVKLCIAAGVAMTIDERLDRLTERHEALAQSLELLHASTQDLRASIEAQASTAAAHDRYLSTLMSAVGKLLETATNHERRLMRLEGPSQA